MQARIPSSPEELEVAVGGFAGHRALIRRVAGVLAVSLALVGVISLAQRGGTDETSTPVDASAWKILFTGNTRGYIHPCGCDDGLFGGLPRRATYLSKARRPQDLLLDLGNLIEGTRPHDRLKLSYLLEGLKRLEYDVLVPGEGELALGEDFETVARSLDGPRVVCANLMRAGTNERVFEPFYAKRLPDGTRVAVVGLMSPYQRLPDVYEAKEPGEVLADALRALQGQADTVVAAGFLDGKVALDLAKAFPDVAVVCAARVPKGADALLRRGGAPGLVGGERGQIRSPSPSPLSRYRYQITGVRQKQPRPFPIGGAAVPRASARELAIVRP